MSERTNKEEKVKVHSEKEVSKKGKIGGLVIPLVFSVVIYFVLLGFETLLLQDRETVSVVTVSQDIPVGTILNETNVGSYVTVTEISKQLAFDGTFSSVEQISGITDVEIKKGQILSKSEIRSLDEGYQDMEDAVEISLKAADLSNMVSGIIRGGDYVNLLYLGTRVDGSAGILKQMDQVYVSDVFDSSCVRIPKSDTETAAAYINVIVSQETAEEISVAQAEGQLVISKSKGL